MKRLCIYSLWTEERGLARYVRQTLSALRPHCEKLLLLGNLPQPTGELPCGVDAWVCSRAEGSAFTCAQSALGVSFAALCSDYDEVLFVNQELMGPIRDIVPMFAEMETADVDAWGLRTVRVQEKTTELRCLSGEFLALRGRLLSGDTFARLLEAVEASAERGDAVPLCRMLSEAGYTWRAYAEDAALERLSADPLVFTPVRFLRETRCPFFSRRCFLIPYAALLACSLGTQGTELMTYLREEAGYDTDLVWEHLLKTAHMADLQTSLCLYEILPEDAVPAELGVRPKVALLLHLYYEELFARAAAYACSMPPWADLYVTTTSPEKQKKLIALFENGPWAHVEVRLIENRGRDISALLVGCRDVLPEYDLVCFAHDKKTAHTESALTGEAFSEHCFENILASPAYVAQVLARFASEPRLGLLSPPPPYHGAYAGTVGGEWSNNYENTAALLARLSLSVPISPEKAPVAPLGTMFWFRPAALRGLTSYPWRYADFPEEPNLPDGTLLHAIERSYPFAAQSAGYYAAYCVSRRYAAHSAINHSELLRAANTTEPRLRAVLWTRMKRTVKRLLPAWSWEAAKRLYHWLRGS